jgi:CRISPR-associated protein Cas1
MPKRTICIQNPAKVSIRNSALLVQNSDGTAAIPLEDIWVVIIETHRAQITTSALSSIVDAGIGLMLCGKDHMPNGLLLPLGAHSRHAAIVDDQLSISKPLQKRLWQRIVVQKIRNQAKVLDLIGQDGKLVRQFASRVLSGDSSNMESAAASVYFRHYITEGTHRDGPVTPPLDYGYAVLRAGIGRTGVSGGWLVSRGLHHSNNLNAFNLIDDLVEPFRPVVDLMVKNMGLEGNLDPQKKSKLASVFELQVLVNGQLTSVQHAIELEFDTLRAAVKSANYTLLSLPEVVPLAYVEQE